MTGLLVALRGKSRTAALIRKPRRKMHVATMRPGDTHWITLCDRDVIVAGTRFWADMEDAGVEADQHPDDVCSDCYRFILLAGMLTARHKAHAHTGARVAGAA
jgi:hypothetical protein